MKNEDMQITVKQSNDISSITTQIFEYGVISIIVILFLLFKYGFDWVYFLIFGIPFVLFLLFAYMYKMILSKRYIKIDTLKNLFEIRKFIKVRTYSLSSLSLKVKVQVDNEKDFLCKMKFYHNDKKIFSIYNIGLRPRGFADKSFYNKLVKHINVTEI